MKYKDRDINLKYNIIAIREIEKKLGKSVFKIASEMEDISIDMLVTLLWAGMKKQFKNITLEETADFLDNLLENNEMNIVEITKLVMENFVESLTGLIKTEEPKN